MNKGVERALYWSGWILGVFNLVFWGGIFFSTLLSEEEGFVNQTKAWITTYGAIMLGLIGLLIVIGGLSSIFI